MLPKAGTKLGPAVLAHTRREAKLLEMTQKSCPVYFPSMFLIPPPCLCSSLPILSSTYCPVPSANNSQLIIRYGLLNLSFSNNGPVSSSFCSEKTSSQAILLNQSSRYQALLTCIPVKVYLSLSRFQSIILCPHLESKGNDSTC